MQCIAYMYNFKNSRISSFFMNCTLIFSLQDARFIHCIKPNAGNDIWFDTNFVSTQLKTIGAGPLLSLMRHGHSGRLYYEEIITKFRPYVSNDSISRTKDFCRDVLRFIGCDLNALLMGCTQIFFRSKSEKFANELISLNENQIRQAAEAANFKCRIRKLLRLMCIRLRFVVRILLNIKERRRKKEKSETSTRKRPAQSDEDMEEEPQLYEPVPKKVKTVTWTMQCKNEENIDTNNSLLQPQSPITMGKVRAKTEKRPDNSLRYDRVEHNKEKSDKRQRCKRESCKYKSSQICSKCNVHLCTGERDCFNKFHSLT